MAIQSNLHKYISTYIINLLFHVLINTKYIHEIWLYCWYDTLNNNIVSQNWNRCQRKISKNKIITPTTPNNSLRTNQNKNRSGELQSGAKYPLIKGNWSSTYPIESKKQKMPFLTPNSCLSLKSKKDKNWLNLWKIGTNSSKNYMKSIRRDYLKK